MWMNSSPSGPRHFAAPPGRASARSGVSASREQVASCWCPGLRLGVIGMFWVGMPYLMRDQIAWALKSKSRWLALSAGGIAYGAAILFALFSFTNPFEGWRKTVSYTIRSVVWDRTGAPSQGSCRTGGDVRLPDDQPRLGAAVHRVLAGVQIEVRFRPHRLNDIHNRLKPAARTFSGPGQFSVPGLIPSTTSLPTSAFSGFAVG